MEYKANWLGFASTIRKLFHNMNLLSFILLCAITYSYAKDCEDKRQEWNNCASACGSPSCLDAFYTGQPPLMCTDDCKQRCECIRGKYILGINKEGCIPIENCPQKISCPEGRIYRENECPKTCSNRNMPCTELKKGCFCPKGLLEDGLGNCIPANYCPIGCFAGKIEDKCASPCQPTCLNPRPATCAPFDCKKQCVCSPPYVQNDRGDCIDINNCPKCEIEGMVYHECGNCKPTCKNYQLLDCPKICVKGCRCKEGTVLDENRKKCIAAEFCSCPTAA